MTTPAKQPTHAATCEQNELAISAGRAAGYCWARNPHGPGRCTWPPQHSGMHRDHYAHTEWPCRLAITGLPRNQQS